MPKLTKKNTTSKFEGVIENINITELFAELEAKTEGQPIVKKKIRRKPRVGREVDFTLKDKGWIDKIVGSKLTINDIL